MAGECVVCGRARPRGVPFDEDGRCSSCILREIAWLSSSSDRVPANKHTADDLIRLAERLEHIMRQLPEDDNRAILADAARYVRLAAQAFNAGGPHGEDEDEGR
jgi:hypothetical protein